MRHHVCRVDISSEKKIKTMEGISDVISAKSSVPPASAPPTSSSGTPLPGASVPTASMAPPSEPSASVNSPIPTAEQQNMEEEEGRENKGNKNREKNPLSKRERNNIAVKKCREKAKLEKKRTLEKIEAFPIAAQRMRTLLEDVEMPDDTRQDLDKLIINFLS